MFFLNQFFWFFIVNSRVLEINIFSGYNRLMGLLYHFFLLVFAASLPIKITSPYACLLNTETKKMVYGKNAHTKIYPGSVTKLAVALYLFDECEVDLDRIITCPSDVLKVTTEKKKKESNFTLPAYILEDDGTTVYLRAGERISFGDLLYAFLLKSANDAGNVIASSYFDSIEIFQDHLNEYLKTIGCKNTHFVNPHGLHHPDHLTTPYDLCLIALEAKKHPGLVKILETTTYKIPKTNLSQKRVISNYNYLIDPKSSYYVPEVVGGKTGYHRLARFNVASFASNGERTLACAVNKAPKKKYRFIDSRKIYEAAFAEKKEKRLLFNAEETRLKHKFNWAHKTVQGSILNDVYYEYFPTEEENISVSVHFDQLSEPFSKGDIIGFVHILRENSDTLDKYPIYALDNIQYSLLYRCRALLGNATTYMKDSPYAIFFALFAFIPLFLWRIQKFV